MQSISSSGPVTATDRVARWGATHKWWVLASTGLVLVTAMFVPNAVEVKLMDENEFAEGEWDEAVRLYGGYGDGYGRSIGTGSYGVTRDPKSVSASKLVSERLLR